MKVILIDENYEFNHWITENFGSEENYNNSIALFELKDFFNTKDGFLGFRFSVKKYLSWLSDKFKVREVAVDMKNQLLTYTDKAKKLIIEFSYKHISKNYDNFIVNIHDDYNGSNYSLTYKNFKKLINDSTQIIASILIELFPDKFNVNYEMDMYGNSAVKVPELF